MRGIKSLLVVLSCIFATLSFGETSPVPMLESTAGQIIHTLSTQKANLKSNKAIINQAIRQYLLPHVDVAGMSRSVLGREAWTKASASERSQFAESFTNLVIRTYANPLAEFNDEKIKFMPIRGGVTGRFVRVNSIIVRSSGPNIPLSYSLVNKGGEWKIYDMSVEGVSLLQSFKQQFAQSLQSSNMKTLIEQMNQRRNKAA